MIRLQVTVCGRLGGYSNAELPFLLVSAFALNLITQGALQHEWQFVDNFPTWKETALDV